MIVEIFIFCARQIFHSVLLESENRVLSLLKIILNNILINLLINVISLFKTFQVVRQHVTIKTLVLTSA